MTLFAPDSQCFEALDLFLLLLQCMTLLKSTRADCRGLFVQSNQANFNFKCRRQACFSSPPLCSRDGLASAELVGFPGKESTDAVLSSLLIK